MPLNGKRGEKVAKRVHGVAQKAVETVARKAKDRRSSHRLRERRDAKRLLANGKLMLKEIAECFGLSLAQVKKLQAEMA